jgi:hypothetical protein
MNPAPKIVGRMEVVMYSPIDERHRFTRNTKQIVRGRLMGVMAGLAICKENPNSFYLFGCDEKWNVVTDTWHASLDDAKHQAEFEYEGISETWETSMSPQSMVRT